MPAYKYEALNAAGSALTGLIEADNPRAARAQLRAKELVPMLITPVQHTNEAARAGLFERRTFNATMLAVWTRQLAGWSAPDCPSSAR